MDTYALRGAGFTPPAWGAAARLRVCGVIALEVKDAAMAPVLRIGAPNPFPTTPARAAD